jgi:4-hydroxybenzoate polyprenyltransferase
MSRLRAYAQLVRLPNVFTAVADVALGALVTGALPQHAAPFALLLAASACLYCGGMVWNDFFDVAQDRRERPFRPIPSGRVARRAAGWLGAGLLAAGWLMAALAGRLQTSGWASPAAGIAGALVAAILLYDGWLKRTWAGPLAMGACRFLNVLLGVSLAPQPHPSLGVYLAAVVGVYIVGVTWFARTEARESGRRDLLGAAALMLAALALAVPLPALLAESPWPRGDALLYPYLLVAFGFGVGVPVCRAIGDPSPGRVQRAVKAGVLGLIVLDAVLATAAVGPAGLGLAVLLAPALLLGRRLYTT